MEGVPRKDGRGGIVYCSNSKAKKITTLSKLLFFTGDVCTRTISLSYVPSISSPALPILLVSTISLLLLLLSGPIIPSLPSLSFFNHSFSTPPFPPASPGPISDFSWHISPFPSIPFPTPHASLSISFLKHLISSPSNPLLRTNPVCRPLTPLRDPHPIPSHS